MLVTVNQSIRTPHVWRGECDRTPKRDKITTSGLDIWDISLSSPVKVSASRVRGCPLRDCQGNYLKYNLGFIHLFCTIPFYIAH